MIATAFATLDAPLFKRKRGRPRKDDPYQTPKSTKVEKLIRRPNLKRKQQALNPDDKGKLKKRTKKSSTFYGKDKVYIVYLFQL